MALIFMDTSALLNKAYRGADKCWTSTTVLSELEEIKVSKNRDEKIKATAREVIRDIILDKVMRVYTPDFRKVDKFIEKNGLSKQVNDHIILAEAFLLGSEFDDSVTFVTSDGALHALVKAISRRHPQLSTIFFDINKDRVPEYMGWKQLAPSDLDMISLYSHPEINVFKAKINEYVKVIDDGKVKDIVRWDGEKYTQLKYKSFSSALQEHIEPRNLEQKMLFDLLQNRDIKIKLCTGNYGTGKTYLMLAHALWLVQKGEFDKIIFIRNNIRVKDTDDLGAMPGDLLSKVGVWLAPLQSHLGLFTMEEMINQSIIEPLPLNFIRGLDARRTILFADECEDMTAQHIQLLIGRLGQDSELFLAGDMKQTDREVFEKNSGITRTIERLAGNPLFGMVKLIKSERSAASELANLLD